MVGVEVGRDLQLNHCVSEPEVFRLEEDFALGSEVRDHSRHVEPFVCLAQVEQDLHSLSQNEQGWES